MKNIKRTIMVIIVIVVVVTTFYSQYIGLKKEVETTAKSKEAQVNRYIDLSKGFIDLIAVYGDDFFQHNKINDSELYSLLKYNNELNSYNLDDIGGTKYQKTVGNLTGIGNIPENGVYRDEVNLALQFNQQFSSIYNKLPDIAWIYYTSKNNFINMYPWVSSEDFSFHMDLKAEKFYTYVTPENDPLCIPVWTPVYLDHAGKGLMVTLSSPVYCGDTFMGAVSLDITNSLLSEMINSDYEIYIIDNTDSVIANSVNIKYDKEVLKIDTLLKTSPDNIDEMKKVKNDTLQIFDMYYIYPVVFDNAPWRMFVRVPILLIAGKSAFFTLPILIICLLLLSTVFEVEKRKKTEVQLRTSLEELTSFQKLLENAAKYDFLTSTMNRRGLEDLFNKNIDIHSKTKVPVGIIMGDIDYFKKINDTYGHAAGDKVLIEFANIMKKNTRNDDVVCRWGGEEFIMVLIDKKYDEAMLFAENIRKEIEAKTVFWDTSMEIRATMTFGVAEHCNGKSIESSISKADAALYVGKRKGRNQVIGYSDVKEAER